MNHPNVRDSEEGLERRKSEHLRVCLEEDVQFQLPLSGFDEIRLPHCAAPELSLHEISLDTEFLSRWLQAPLLISSMTGGTLLAQQVNRNLAIAAQELGLALALGSSRAALEDPDLISTYQVRDVAPSIYLCANLGAVQLNYGYGLEECRRAVELIEADALILHLNPLQEALQEEGNTDYSGLLKKISEVCAGLAVPVIVKEVGWGISEAVARSLADVGVSAIDVAGAGGTSWSRVEMYRSKQSAIQRTAAAFENWGIPTIESLLQSRRGAPNTPLIASGGVRNGVHVAKALALGASLAGIALPLLQPAVRSAEETIEHIREIIIELRMAMFCTGCGDVGSLSRICPSGKDD